MLAIAKRESKDDGRSKVLKERSLLSVASLDEDEKSGISGLDDIQSSLSGSRRNHSNRRYREASAEETTHLGMAISLIIS